MRKTISQRILNVHLEVTHFEFVTSILVILHEYNLILHCTYNIDIADFALP